MKNPSLYYPPFDIASAMSFTSYAAIGALIAANVPLWQAGTFFLLPYTLHRLALVGAKKLDENLDKKVPEEDKKLLIDKPITRLVKAFNPTWPFFAAFLTPCVASALTPLLAPLAPYLFDNAAKRIAIVLTRGVMYTVFIENTDYVGRQYLGLPIEGRKKQADIWQNEVLLSFLVYSIIQALQPSCGVFIAGTTARTLRTLLVPSAKTAEQSAHTRITDALMRGLSFGIIYTITTHIRAAVFTYLEAELAGSAFAAMCAQHSLSFTLLSTFIADYVYVVSRDVTELLLAQLVFDPKAIFKEEYSSLLNSLPIKDLGRTWESEEPSIG